jgi:hypothetical protein
MVARALHGPRHSRRWPPGLIGELVASHLETGALARPIERGSPADLPALSRQRSDLPVEQYSWRGKSRILDNYAEINKNLNIGVGEKLFYATSL